jgi:phospholipid transport system substrate-binding protein
MWMPRRSPELRAAALLIALAAAPAAAAQSAPAATPPVPAPATAPPTQPAKTAREFVTSALAEITSALKDHSQAAHMRREHIEELVRRWLDAETISKLALARHWKDLDATQQKDFVDSFRQHLVLTYYRNVDRYQFDRIDVYDAHDEKSKSGDWTVRTKVIAPEVDDVKIDLRLRPTADGSDWKVIDILIEGVSLVQNFRSQFQEVLSDGAPSKLLASLHDLNAQTLKEYEAAEAKDDADRAGAAGGASHN